MLYVTFVVISVRTDLCLIFFWTYFIHINERKFHAACISGKINSLVQAEQVYILLTFVVNKHYLMYIPSPVALEVLDVR